MAIITCPHCSNDILVNDVLMCPFCGKNLTDATSQLANKHVIKCSAYMNQRRYSNRRSGRPSNADRRAFFEGRLNEE